MFWYFDIAFTKMGSQSFRNILQVWLIPSPSSCSTVTCVPGGAVFFFPGECDARMCLYFAVLYKCKLVQSVNKCIYNVHLACIQCQSRPRALIEQTWIGNLIRYTFYRFTLYRALLRFLILWYSVPTDYVFHLFQHRLWSLMNILVHHFNSPLHERDNSWIVDPL